MEKNTKNLNALKIKTKQFILSAMTMLCLCGTAKLQAKGKPNDKSIAETTKTESSLFYGAVKTIENEY